MFSTFQSTTPARPQNSAIADTAARCLADIDDVALGCECANPSLQIERWHQEALQPSGVQA